jgi:hypothetical protein
VDRELPLQGEELEQKLLSAQKRSMFARERREAGLSFGAEESVRRVLLTTDVETGGVSRLFRSRRRQQSRGTSRRRMSRFVG